MDAMAEADSLSTALPLEVTGTVRVHMAAAFAKHRIVPWLPEFLTAYPSIHVELHTGPTYTDLFDQGFDLAIHSGALPDSSRVACKIGEAEWMTCASPGYLERFGTPSHPRDLPAHQCFSFTFSSMWNEWTFEKNGVTETTPIAARASFSQGDLLRDLALAGAGIVRLADYHVSDDLRAGRLVALLREYRRSVRLPIYVVYPTRRHPSQRVKVFREFLEQKLLEYPWNIT